MIDTAHTPIDKWGLTSVGDELGVDEAHVWRASLDQPANVIAKLAPLLSQDEYQRAMKYYRPVDRDRFIVGRGILRKIISAYLALPPGQLRFTYNEYGKPAVSDDQNVRQNSLQPIFSLLSSSRSRLVLVMQSTKLDFGHFGSLKK